MGVIVMGDRHDEPLQTVRSIWVQAWRVPGAIAQSCQGLRPGAGAVGGGGREGGWGAAYVSLCVRLRGLQRETPNRQWRLDKFEGALDVSGVRPLRLRRRGVAALYGLQKRLLLFSVRWPLHPCLEMTLVRHCRGALGAMCCALPPRTATPPSPWSLQAGRRCRNGQAHEVGEHATLTARGRRWRAQGPPTRALVRPPRCVHRRSLHRRLNHRHRP